MTNLDGRGMALRSQFIQSLMFLHHFEIAPMQDRMTEDRFEIILNFFPYSIWGKESSNSLKFCIIADTEMETSCEI